MSHATTLVKPLIVQPDYSNNLLCGLLLPVFPQLILHTARVTFVRCKSDYIFPGCRTSWGLPVDGVSPVIWKPPVSQSPGVLNCQFLGRALAGWLRISGPRTRTMHSYTVKIWESLAWNRKVKLINMVGPPGLSVDARSRLRSYSCMFCTLYQMNIQLLDFSYMY